MKRAFPAAGAVLAQGTERDKLMRKHMALMDPMAKQMNPRAPERRRVSPR